ncbi:MAG: hypothetical protein ABL962_14460 [Fimbriimonadaceae bacterium]
METTKFRERLATDLVSARALLPNGYLSAISHLEQGFPFEVWLTGGWTLAAALGAPRYAGDVDVIVMDTKKAVAAGCAAMGLAVQFTAFGSPRIILDDGNHIDILCKDTFEGTNTPADILGRFPYSVTSQAVTGESYLQTPEAVRDLASRTVSLNDAYRYDERQLISVLKTLDVLASYYGLEVGRDPATQQLVAKRALVAPPPRTAVHSLMEVGDAVRKFIPPQISAWLARGIVRAAWLEDISYWDDYDVVVDCPNEEVLDFLRTSGIPFALNFFGCPKVTLPYGQHMDILPLRPGERVENLLTSFVHRVDALLWSVHDQRIVDPLEVLPELVAGRMRLNDTSSSSESDLRYAAIKAEFLLLRHGLEPSEECRIIMDRAYEFSYLDRRNALKLVQHLSATGCDFSVLLGASGEPRTARALLRYYVEKGAR